MSSVQVTWNSNDTVDEVTYQSLPLIDTIKERLRHLTLTRADTLTIPLDFLVLLEELLNGVASLPLEDKRKKIHLADRIFENLLAYRFNPPNPRLQSSFWRDMIQKVWEWEDTHEKVHKGTAYFFMAESYLSSGDIPSAYTCFFNALEDDKANFPSIKKNLKDAPAYRTTSLVDNIGNNLYWKVVVPLRTSLIEFMDDYTTRTMSKLDIQTIDRKFLQADPLEDVKRVFVATFHEIYHLASMNSTRMINNDYSKLKVIGTLFTLGLVIDQTLAYRFLNNVKGEKRMGKSVYHLALQQGWTSSQDSTDPGVFLGRVNPQLNQGTPDQILPALLNGTATYDSKPMDHRLTAILAAYHLRNYGGHHLEGSNILVSSYDQVLQLVMDAFFVSIESL